MTIGFHSFDVAKLLKPKAQTQLEQMFHASDYKTRQIIKQVNF